MQKEASPNFPSCLQAFPDKVVARIEQRHRELVERMRNTPNTFTAQYVINRSKRWAQHDTITVAFKGGDNDTRKKIKEAAMQWSNHINLTLDFGNTSQNQSLRSWSDTDEEKQADIRICFDQSGYWSAVGTDANTIFRANEATMCLQNFDQSLPNTYIGTVIHEFGHALGCEHEHQIPLGGCEAEFKWEDDDGYQSTKDQFGQYVTDNMGRRPGLYTYFSGFPNEWTANKVNRNLKQLPESSAYLFDDFDERSIMRYTFPRTYFKTGSQSFCYLNWTPQRLSDMDKEGISKAYPKELESALAIAVENSKAIDEILDTNVIDDSDFIDSIKREKVCNNKIIK